MNATSDWYEVEDLGGSNYRVSEGVVFNNYLLDGAESAILIDAGIGFGDMASFVTEFCDGPVSLLLSHSHWDHMGAAYQFDDVRIDDREVTDGDRVVPKNFGYTPAEFIDEWQGAGRSLPDSFDPASYELRSVEGVDVISAGETIDLGDRTVELIDAAGHSPGQLAVLDRDNGVLFGSDIIHNNYDLYIHFDGCDIAAYEATLDRVVSLRDAGAFETLYLAHSRPLAGEEVAKLDLYLDAVREIIAGDRPFEMVAESSGEARRYDVGEHHIYTQPSLSV